MVLKLRSKKLGRHVHFTVFVGADEDHFAACGTLVMLVGEYERFLVTLFKGADTTDSALSSVTVENADEGTHDA